MVYFIYIFSLLWLVFRSIFLFVRKQVFLFFTVVIIFFVWFCWVNLHYLWFLLLGWVDIYLCIISIITSWSLTETWWINSKIILLLFIEIVRICWDLVLKLRDLSVALYLVCSNNRSSIIKSLLINLLLLFYYWWFFLCWALLELRLVLIFVYHILSLLLLYCFLYLHLLLLWF